MPTWAFISFQDSASPTIEQLTFFHDHSIIILTLVTILTLYVIVASYNINSYNNTLLEGQEIETIWTILPAFLLIFIAIPSMNILYLMEESNDSVITVNVTGHQWYWSYEYADFTEQENDSFIETSSNIRLLNCSDSITIPVNAPTRFLVTSADVIHSWAIPSMGVNADASPGRLNQLIIQSNRLGLFTGQCSEICGANHSFIPIILEVLPTNNFSTFISSINS